MCYLIDLVRDCERLGVDCGGNFEMIKRAATLSKIRSQLLDKFEWAYLNDMGTVWMVIYDAVRSEIKATVEAI